MKYCLFLFFAYAGFADPVWTPEKMMELKGISEVRLSPDNNSVLYVVKEAELDKDRFYSRIYKRDLTNASDPIQISSYESSAGSPRWSPDGQKIAFRSKGNLYVIEKGTPRLLFEGKKGVKAYVWSPDSQRIAFVMEDEKKGENKSDLIFFDKNELVYRLWVVDLEGKSKPLTDESYVLLPGGGDQLHEQLDWSPDGQEIAFAYYPQDNGDIYLSAAIARIDVETGAFLNWEKKGPYEALPRYSPDGNWIAYVSSGEKASYDTHSRVEIRSRDGGEWRVLAPTLCEGTGLLTCSRLIGWTADGLHTIFYEPKGTKTHLTLLPIDGSSGKEVDTGDWFFTFPNVSLDRNHLTLIVQSSNSPPEAYITSLDPFRPVQITDLNRGYETSIETEVIRWKSFDGLEIEGLLTYPADYKKGERYPLILMVHGGPQSNFFETFIRYQGASPPAIFADRGYVVLRPNPRGSAGYGLPFLRLNFMDWGGGDYFDLMAGVDFLIDQGLVDSNRMGVMGWSYGGYMTSWIITQTDRFKAASMGAGICNLISHSGTTDVIGYYPDFFGDLWENGELYRNRSPLTFASQVKTPCLIQHGLNDKRVPVSQGQEFYRALKNIQSPVQMVLYPNMEHVPDQPKQILDITQRNLDWFEEHLQKP